MNVNEVIKLLNGYYAVKTLARSRMYLELELLPTEIHNGIREHIYQVHVTKRFSSKL